MKNWALIGDVLEVREGDVHLAATADQIYSSILEKIPAWPDMDGGKTGDAKALAFSRYPVDFFAIITNDESTGRPFVSFEAKTQTGNSFSVSRQAIVRGHVVHDKTWYPAFPENARDITTILEEAGYDPDTGELTALKGFLHLRKIASRDGPVIDRFSDQTLKSLVFDQNVTAKPSGIHAKLYPYQLDGWRWLRFIANEQLGGLLADEMGLGKTLQVISVLRDPGTHNKKGGALVIAPGSLLENWIREIEKFCPDFRTLKHQGSKRTGRPADLEGFDIVVISYDTAVRDLSLLMMIAWNVVVLDEAQNIRNPYALRTKSVKQIVRNVGLAVTGTPFENRLRDLWSIMDFVVPGYLADLKDFEARYGDNLNAATALEPLVSPLMLRRLVREVANDLPKRIDVPEVLELRDAEAMAYDAVREAVFEEYGTAATLVSLGRLRQFCSHPDIVENGVYDGGTEFSKFERLKELLEEIFISGEKALIFTSYTKMADRITEMISREFDAMSATLDGRVAIQSRQPLIDNFSTHETAAALILNPKTGGSGLNITAANHVIHYNPEWNPALEDQASARAYRRGQERPVTVRRLICAGTVEETIDERLQRKRGLADAAVIGVEGNEEDYADILSALNRSPSIR